MGVESCHHPFNFENLPIASRNRWHQSIWAGFLFALAITGCAHAPARLPVIDQTSYEGATKDILVATNRTPSDDPLVLYGDGRSDRLSFDHITVWAPADRKPGSVSYPSKVPKPDTEFAVTDIRHLDASTFQERLVRGVNALQGERLIFIFVHGYNVPYGNGVYRHAQLMEDFGARGVAVHFSWPSSGRSLGYLYDRDSIQFARDGLVEVLTLSAASGADSIFVMGHSMGTLLVMEALRQLSLSGDVETLSKIAPLVLASPDIDVDVFWSQLHAISIRPEPTVIFVSQQDGALKLSERLRGGRERVGKGSNISELQEEGIVVIDLSKQNVGEGTKHVAFASSPALIRALREIHLSQDTQRSADRSQIDRLAPLVALRDLTAGIVYLPKGIIEDTQ